ncbi:MAG: tRNA pseudouridine(13) synthase TruD [Myxococcaceae bacterium]
MKIKQRPEDFSVKESWRFDEIPGGSFRVYVMDKQKLSTFEAVERIRTRFGLRPGVVSFCGLKDKQGRTEQLIAVDGADVDLQDPDLRLKYLGRTDRPLSAANTTSNRFSVTVRALAEDDLRLLTISAAEVSRLGVVNYFDSQRFGSLKHGQGFIAKDLLRGDFEAALKNYMARPSPLDRTEDAKVKAFWRDNWGQWLRKAPFKGNAKYYRILRVLREDPKDYVKAFLQIDSNYRALLLFEYQSYLWNEGVRRLMQLLLPREHLFPAPYQAGTLLFHRDAPPEVLRYLRDGTFPLLAPNSTFTDPKVKEAVEWVLGKEKLTLDKLRIAEAPRMLYFKHEERPVLVYPGKLVLGRRTRDELNRGSVKLNVAFTLPPGSYATLVIRRLFHFSWQEEAREEIERRAADTARAAEFDFATRDSGGTAAAPAAPGKGRARRPAPRLEAETVPEAVIEVERPKVERPKAERPKPEPELGFRERQKLKKDQRAKDRAGAKAKPKPSKSKKKPAR